MNSYNEVFEVPFKLLNQLKDVSTNRFQFLKDLIPNAWLKTNCRIREEQYLILDEPVGEQLSFCNTCNHFLSKVGHKTAAFFACSLSKSTYFFLHTH